MPKRAENSIHNQAINAFVAKHPNAQRYKFCKSVRVAVQDDESLESLPQCVPDIFEIRKEEREVFVYEIEDSSKITPQKLSYILDWWFALDCIGWNLYCISLDRYGNNPSIIDLPAFYYTELKYQLQNVKV